MEREFRSAGIVSFDVYHMRVNERLGTSYTSTLISNINLITGWILEPPPFESLQ